MDAIPPNSPPHKSSKFSLFGKKQTSAPDLLKQATTVPTPIPPEEPADESPKSKRTSSVTSMLRRSRDLTKELISAATENKGDSSMSTSPPLRSRSGSGSLVQKKGQLQILVKEYSFYRLAWDPIEVQMRSGRSAEEHLLEIGSRSAENMEHLRQNSEDRLVDLHYFISDVPCSLQICCRSDLNSPPVVISL